MIYDVVFEGGGAKGMAFVGACEVFFQRGHTTGRLLGTSAGAITAALLAAGYTPAELLAALEEREGDRPVFASFMELPQAPTVEELGASSLRALLRNLDVRLLPGFIEDRMDEAFARLLTHSDLGQHLFALIEHGGWYVADRFIAWLEVKLDSGTWRGGQRSFSRMTLAEFYAATQVDLSLVASDTTDNRLLVLNHRTAPGCPLVWAIRMSMSIPLVWNEVIWLDSWGSYLGRPLAGHAIVDGGLLSNFPLELFISDEPQVISLMGPRQAGAVLGLLIDENLPVPPVAGSRGLLLNVNVKASELTTLSRLQRLVNTATTAHDKMVLDAFNHLVVRLPAKTYGTTEFDMSEERRAALLAAARAAVGAYFDHPPAEPPRPRSLEREAVGPGQRSADRIALDLLHPTA